MSALTIRDNLILKTLFDPEAAATSAPQYAKPTVSLPGMTEDQFSASRSTELRIIVSLQDDTSDRDLIETAIKNLSNLIQESPGYASAYINRAQARRMLIPVEGLFTAEHAEASGSLLSDLRRGIELAEPATLEPSISDHRRQVLSAAYTHRGFLLLKIADMLRAEKPIHGVSERLQSASPESIEEQASRDFALGGKWGNKEAQEMAVRTNPYAKMCGAIVKEALRKENEEWKASQLC